jgi:hypothetical protein
MGARPDPAMMGGLLLSATSFTNGFWAPHDGHKYLRVVSAMIGFLQAVDGFLFFMHLYLPGIYINLASHP